MRRWNAPGIAVLALLGTNPAVAQEGLRFTAPASAVVGRDDGFLAHGQKLTDTILVLRPAQSSLREAGPRTDFDVSYQPEFELFANNRDLNAWNHTGSAALTFRVTRRLTFNANDEALATQDPTKALAGSLLFLPRREFRQNKAHAGLEYAMSRKSTLSLSVDNIVATVPPESISPRTGRLRSAANVSLAHLFGRKHTITAAYSRLNDSAQYGGLSYRAELSRDSTLRFSTGLLDDRGKTYLMSVQFEKRLRTGAIEIGYDRLHSTFGTSIENGVSIGNDLLLPAGVGRNNVYHVVSVAVSGNFGDRVHAEVDARVKRNSSVAAARDVNASGRFKLDYALTPHWKLSGDFQFYSQPFNDFVGAPINRKRYTAGLQFDISPRPNQSNRDTGDNHRAQ